MGDLHLRGEGEQFVLTVEQGELAAVAGRELPDRELRAGRLTGHHSSLTASSGSAAG